MNFFNFNPDKDKRIRQIIAEQNLKVGSFNYETYMGADIVFQRDDQNIWNFTLYRRIAGTTIEVPMILAGLVSIIRREKPWYKKTKLPMDIEVSNFLQEENIKDTSSVEIAEEILYSLYNAVHYSFETDLALTKQYLTFDEVRDLTKYYQQTSISIAMAFQYLACMSSIRKNGGDTTYFNDVLIKRKRYDMLQVVDVIEETTSQDYIDFRNIKKMFHLLYPRLDTVSKDLHQISTDIMNDSNSDTPRYHLAISFAGEDRHVAKQIADSLTNSGYKVFYDEYEKANLWGKDLYSHLTDVYSKRAKYCLMIISKNYAEKNWTTLERKAAQAKAFEQTQEYILPLRLDETEIPGLNKTVGYLNFQDIGLEETVSILKQKINS